MQKLLTSAQTAELLGVARETVIHYAATGKIAASHFGRRWKFRPEDVEQFIRDQRRSR